jgi:hypothetical protein
MANDVFNIATDLKISYLNSTIGAYVDITADSFEIDIDRGIEIEDGVFAKGSVGTATVKLVKKSLSDFLGTPGYKANDRFFIEYRPLPDSSPSTWNVLFGGYIQNVSMGYINESGTLEVTIVVNDIMRWAMNVIIPSFAISGTVVQRSFRNCMINLFGAISTQAAAIGGVTLQAGGVGASGTTQRVSITYQNLPAGEIVQKYIDAELAWMWANKNLTNTVKYLARTDVNTLQAVTWNSANPTVSNVHYSDLMTNGTFEVNVTGWATLQGSTAITRDTTTYYAGVASARVANTAGNANSFGVVTNTTMAFTAGDKVKASVWVKRETNSGSTRIQLDFKNSGGSTLGSIVGAYTPTSASEWIELDVTGVAPAGTMRAQVTIQSTKSASGNASIFMDNAKLQNLTTISANHYCLDSINLVYDSDILVNKVVVTDIVSGIKYTATNAASVAANGQQSGDFNADLDPAGASTFAQLATEIANAATIKQVQSVTVPVIRDDGKAGTIGNFEIGDTLQVEFAQDPLPALQVVSLVSRINHVITPDMWLMNIGLWRGI